ncbi:activity-regulated cytoskeleton associated protein 2 [Scaptodrosophila lebanonensis]|uniref:Activity-regulated cytoskeleton associated protein 2 n=1 Tax=Drosophila lebanonensis TaxID=7225 RepID=A0A6J2UIM7_DROLE|nr:activity-regulated cytoskeleton associated protein 2 [Scaptodrosophila lebanonensis]
MAQLSEEQFRILIETIRALAPPKPEEPQSKGSFSNCTVRFSGQRDNDAVDEFITAIETYKDVEGISDRDALKGISLLFNNIAITWWKGVRREAKTWQDALTLLRDHFSPTKPSYQIYMEIFETKQSNHEVIDAFVCNKRALLAKLPDGRHDEETELDFVYGLMLSKYRDHIPRHEIKTFRELLERGRSLERTRH